MLLRRSNPLLFTRLALRAIGSMEWSVVALQETGGVESRNLACVVLAQRGHRKRLRDRPAVLDLVRQRFGKGSRPSAPADTPPTNYDRDTPVLTAALIRTRPHATPAAADRR